MLNLRGQRLVAAVAIAAVVFGILTVVTGTRVLLGTDPGYVVYPPLLRFNTIMGVVYVVVGILAWRSLRLGSYGAGAVFVLNAAALGTIACLYGPSGSIAGTSLQAMTFRTVVWLAFFLALLFVVRTRHDGRDA